MSIPKTIETVSEGRRDAEARLSAAGTGSGSACFCRCEGWRYGARRRAGVVIVLVTQGFTRREANNNGLRFVGAEEGWVA